jgi:hypothetical protein
MNEQELRDALASDDPAVQQQAIEFINRAAAPKGTPQAVQPEPEPEQEQSGLSRNFIGGAAETLGLPGTGAIRKATEGPNAAIWEAARDTKTKPAEEGIITELGKKAVYAQKQIMNLPKMLVDGLDAVIPDDSEYQKLIDPIVDAQMTADERMQAYEDKINSGEADFLTKGMYAFENAAVAATPITIPFTVAAAITGQSSDPWSDPPEAIKGMAGAEAIFELTQMILPGIFTGGLASAGSKTLAGTAVKTVAAEGLIEAAAHDAPEEMMLTRYTAAKIGEIATHFYGEEAGVQVVKELLDGNTKSRIYMAVMNVLQVAGFVGLADGVGKIFSNTAPTEVVEAAKARGKTVDEVVENLDNKNIPDYNADTEPQNSAKIDSTVPTVKATKEADGNEYINLDGMTSENYRRPDVDPIQIEMDGKTIMVGPDSLPMTEGDIYAGVYFSNPKNLLGKKTATEEMFDGLQIATEELVRQRPTLVQKMWQTTQAAKALADIQTNIGYDDLMKPNSKIVSDLADSKFLMDAPPEIWTRAKKSGLSKVKQMPHFKMATIPGAQVLTQILRDNVAQMSVMASKLDQMASSQIRQDPELAMQAVALMENLGVIAAPLRKIQRNFYLTGEALQDKNIIKTAEKVKEIEAALEAGDLKRVSRTMGLADILQYKQLKGITEKMLAGDKDATRIYNQIMSQMSKATPEQMMKFMDLTEDILGDTMKGLRGEIFSQLFYAFMLSRATTQAAAFAGTSVRMMITPIAGMIAQGMKMPFSRKASQAFAYHAGELVGGFYTVGNALDVWRRSMITNVPLNSGTRYDVAGNPMTLMKKREQARLTFEKRVQELASRGAGFSEFLGAHTTYQLSRLAFNPFINSGPRMLMANDEGFKVMRGGQIGFGTAFLEAAQKGDYSLVPAAVDQNLKKIFVGGVKTGKINPESALGEFVTDSAKLTTFQRSIPEASDPNAGGLAQFFRSVQSLADGHPFFKYFNPFVRMGWDVSEQTTTYFPGARFVNTPHNKRAQEIIAKGTADDANPADVARYLEFESNMAAAELLTMSAVTAALMGVITGSTTNGNQPKNSFILPNVIDKEGATIAISYEKLEPYATWLRITADTVAAFRDSAIDKKQYGKAMGQIATSFGVAMIDKNWLAGTTSISQLLDSRNWNAGNAANIISSLGGGIAPAGGRGIGNVVDPRKKAIFGEGDLEHLNNVGRMVGKNFTGGAGVGAPLTDGLTAKPLYNVATMEGYNPNLGALLQEFLPFKTSNVHDPDDEVVQIANKLDYVHNPNEDFRKIGNLELDPTQQSILSEDVHEYGRFREKVTTWWKSEGQYMYKEYKKQLAKDGSGEGKTKSAVQFKTMQTMMRNLWSQAKEEALMYGRLSEDESLIEQQMQRNNLRSSAPITDQGLYQTAAAMEAQNQLPTDVQTILNFA